MRSPFFYIPLMMLSIPAYLFAQTNELKLDTGEEIYKAACIGCHGPNGKGQPETTLGFAKPPQFPDFSDSNGTTRASGSDWPPTSCRDGHRSALSELQP